MINALQSSNSEHDQALHRDFFEARHAAEAASQFVRGSTRFPLTGTGDVNLYALFAELALNLTASRGRAGIIVPTGIATDDSTKAYFEALTSGKRLASLYDFENREKLFKSVDSRMKFVLLTIADQIDQADLMFFSTRIEHLEDKERLFQLSPEDFALINPNTRTCPVFRAKKDAELTRKLYRHAPVLMQEDPEANPWNIKFQAMFHMSADSHLFHTYEQLDDQGAQLEGNQFHLAGIRYLPLYEAKMVHHYDHRFATYETDGETTRDTTLAEKQQADYAPLPRYWVEEREVLLRTADMPRAVLDGLKKQDTAKLETGLRQWLAGQLLIRDQFEEASQLLGSRVTKRGTTGNLFQTAEFTKEGLAARKMAEDHPMTDAELDDWLTAFSAQQDYLEITEERLKSRCPKYLIGWRDITNATNERTVIAGVTPLAAAGDTFLLMFPKVANKQKLAGLVADQGSLVHDYVARQKIGGTHLKYHVKKQIATLPPEAYSEKDLEYITPRVLELTYTSHDLAPFARDLGYDGEPFAWEPDRRHQLRCELDAYYARLYGLTRDELRYILDPADVMGPDYPSVTFPGLKRKEIATYGEYLTQRRVLEAFDQLAATEGTPS